MVGSSGSMKTETEKTEKVVDTHKPSDKKVAGVALDQTKRKSIASVIPAKRRSVKRMIFDSICNSLASSSSSAFCLPSFFRSSSSSESDKAADDHCLPLTISINDKKNNDIYPDQTP